MQTKDLMMADRRLHSLEQSPFYKLMTRQKLATVLGVELKEINALRRAADNFIRFTSDTGRDIQWPKPRLRRIQKRVADLLSRIEPPEFLHSAIRGRSYITNAK